MDEECPICTSVTLKEAVDSTDGLGSLDGCDHLFCHPCLKRWVTDFTNTCPLCKGEAKSLVQRKRLGGERGRIVASEVTLEAREARGRLDEMTSEELEQLVAEDDAAQARARAA